LAHFRRLPVQSATFQRLIIYYYLLHNLKHLPYAKTTVTVITFTKWIGEMVGPHVKMISSHWGGYRCGSRLNNDG